MIGYAHGMVPMRFVFRSKWWALLWCAGICLSAAQFAAGREDGGNNSADALNASDLLD